MNEWGVARELRYCTISAREVCGWSGLGLVFEGSRPGREKRALTKGRDASTETERQRHDWIMRQPINCWRSGDPRARVTAGFLPGTI
jgi:hypothetical protein